MKTNIYMVGNTHFDPVWLWTWDEAMASIWSTFRSALDTMKIDKDFKYSFATPPVFEWIKKVDPSMMEEIKEAVCNGQWELAEGWWLQPDCFSGCGESYVRQGLYGQRYLMENFGKYSDTVFNIDSFGHSSMMPQILKKSHIDYYCMCRPESYHYKLDKPYFRWKSKDGSTVLAFRAGEYGEIYNKNMVKSVEEAEEKSKDLDCDIMMVYGVTNHGGAPTRKALSDIHALDLQKDYNIKCSTVSDYFKSQKEPPYIVEDEFVTKDFGVYTNAHKIKKRNRIAEYAIINAEKASVIAKNQLEIPYPQEKINQCWKDIMFNQFHDILGGACIQNAYFDAYNQQGRAIFSANEILHYSIQAITRKIKVFGKNPDNPWNIVVWNLNSSDFDGYIEAEIQWLHEFGAYSKGIALEDNDGKVYPCQLIREGSVIPGFRSRFVFKGCVPAMGYNSFKTILTEESEQIITNPNIDISNIATSAFEISINEKTGFLQTVKDKQTNSIISNTILNPVCYEDEGDTWCFNINEYGKKLEDFQLSKIEVVEDGIHRVTIKTTSYFRKSKLELYYTFYNEEKYFDVSYKVNWNEKHVVLKLQSNTTYSDITVSAPYTSMKRYDCEYDMPMGEWACMHKENEGLAFICDSIFAYIKNKNTLSLSILRSPIFGDLRLEDINLEDDYPIMENGICQGKIRVLSYSGSCYDNKINELATAFNNKPIVIDEANHTGILGATKKYVNLISKTVSIGAFKKCEDDDSDIIRLFEYGGENQSVVLEIFENKFTISMKKYEIKTLKICDNEIKEIYMTEDN